MLHRVYTLSTILQPNRLDTIMSLYDIAECLGVRQLILLCRPNHGYISFPSVTVLLSCLGMQLPTCSRRSSTRAIFFWPRDDLL